MQRNSTLTELLPLFLLLVILFNTPVEGAVRLVSFSTGADTGDCTSTACASINYALSVSVSQDEIALVPCASSPCAWPATQNKIEIRTSITFSSGASKAWQAATAGPIFYSNQTGISVKFVGFTLSNWNATLVQVLTAGSTHELENCLLVGFSQPIITSMVPARVSVKNTTFFLGSNSLFNLNNVPCTPQNPATLTMSNSTISNITALPFQLSCFNVSFSGLNLAFTQGILRAESNGTAVTTYDIDSSLFTRFNGQHGFYIRDAFMSRVYVQYSHFTRAEALRNGTFVVISANPIPKTVTFFNCTFIRNNATSNGSAIYVDGKDAGHTTLNIFQTHFEMNSM